MTTINKGKTIAYPTVGKLARTLRERKSLTVEAVGTILGWDAQRVTAIESGQQVDAGDLLALLGALGYSPVLVEQPQGLLQ